MMDLIISAAGLVRCVYGEDLDLSQLGRLEIRRASQVEPDLAGQWWADLAPLQGPRIGPFRYRSDAIAAELTWLSEWMN